MSEQHTQEPWDSFCDVCESSTPHPESEPIVRIGFADYKRARACVNACAGISDDSLADDCVIKMRDDRDLLLKQRDELLAYNQTRTDELLAAVHQASELKVQCGKLITSLEKYQVAGFGNSTDFFKQGEAYDSSVESLASVKGGAA